MENSLERILESISEFEKNIMYAHSKSLYSLKLLSEFPFTKFIKAFKLEGGFLSCSLASAEKDLILLGNILSNFILSPSAHFLEALFLS
jgi:hypothetical protein